MTNNIKTRLNLDRVIDNGNIEELNQILNSIDIDEKPYISVEDLISKCESEEKIMKKKPSFKILAAVASIAVIATVSVGASTLLKHFSFTDSKGRYTTVSTKDNISKEEAKKLAEYDSPAPNENNTLDPDKFSNLKDAEKKYNMKVVLPGIMPDIKLNNITGSELYIDENNKKSTVWLDYGDINNKAFGIVATKEDFKADDITGVSSADVEDTGKTYVSEKGYEFNVLTDTDETGTKTAYIYNTFIGNYEYSISFLGFDDSEIKNVINSLDLSEYK